MEYDKYPEMRVIDGKHFLFYNGVKIPMQISSVVIQDINDESLIDGYIARARVLLWVKLKESQQ